MQAASPLQPWMQATSCAAVAVSQDAMSRVLRGDEAASVAMASAKVGARTDNCMVGGKLMIPLVIEIQCL
jgi:hypothetical protein